MLNSEVTTALNQHIDNVINNLPNMKEHYYSLPPEIDNDFGWILHDILHDIRHESTMVFMRHSNCRFPTDKEQEEIRALLDNRTPEIVATLKSLHWV